MQTGQAQIENMFGSRHFKWTRKSNYLTVSYRVPEKGTNNHLSQSSQLWPNVDYLYTTGHPVPPPSIALLAVKCVFKCVSALHSHARRHQPSVVGRVRRCSIYANRRRRRRQISFHSC